MAICLDSPDNSERGGIEKVLHTAWTYANQITENNDYIIDFARSAPWDCFSPCTGAGDTAGTTLLKIMASNCFFDSCVIATDLLNKPPECNQFVERFLPGVVNRCAFYGYPKSCINWATEWPDYSDKPRPFLEYARIQSGDLDKDNDDSEYTKEFDFDGKLFSPVTTKAGSRLWSISFSDPTDLETGVNRITTMNAAYQMQLLVRYDRGRDCLMYDCFEYLPITKSEFIANSAAGNGVTKTEMIEVEALLKKTRKQTRHIQSMRSGDDGEDEEPLRRGASLEERIDYHGLQNLHYAVSYIRFKKSKCHRVRFPLSAVCGARLLGYDYKRPYAQKSEYPIGLTGDTKSSHLGERDEMEEDVEEPEEEEEPRFAKKGTFEWGHDAVEPLGVLVLEFPHRGGNITGKSFSDMTLYTEHRRGRVRVPSARDWTPNAAFSSSTRHYICGDMSEMVELCQFLCQESPHIASLLRFPEESTVSAATTTTVATATAATATTTAATTDKAVSSEVEMPPELALIAQHSTNSLYGAVDLCHPSATPGVPSLSHLIATSLLSEKSGTPSDPKAAVASTDANKPFKTCDEVHAFLKRAGVSEGNSSCFKAGLLSGSVKVPPELVHAEDASSFMDIVLFQGNCLEGCGKRLQCTMRDALNQYDCGGDDYEDGGQNGGLQCEDCECGFYLQGMCSREKLELDSGKYFNHCTQCPEFGECIGDYRNSHCHSCGNHYFSGRSGFNCSCRGGGGGGMSDDEDEDSEGGFMYGGSDSDESDDDDDNDNDNDDTAAVEGTTGKTSPPIPLGCWNGNIVGVTLQSAFKDQPKLLDALLGGSNSNVSAPRTPAAPPMLGAPPAPIAGTGTMQNTNAASPSAAFGAGSAPPFIFGVPSAPGSPPFVFGGAAPPTPPQQLESFSPPGGNFMMGGER
jgi:hypothetical protein